MNNQDSKRQDSKRNGCRMGCLGLIVLALIVLGTIGAVAVVTIAFVSDGVSDLKKSAIRHHGRNSGEMGVDEAPSLVEVWSSGSGDTKVARIRLHGMIMFDNSGFLAERDSASAALRAIKLATASHDIRGIILDIDSGGGGITASDIIYKAVHDFKEACEGRVVVAHFGDVAASGAYYVALAADKIVAHPTSLTGSIGVIMQSYNIRELAAKLGITDVTIKSGTNKDLLNPFHEVSEQQKQMLQEVVDALHGRFVTLVAKERNLSEEQVRSLADGRVMLAQSALASGLIDQIGYSDYVEKLMAELLEVESVQVIRYEEPSGLLDLLRRRPRFGFNFNALEEAGRARFLYESGL
ncbi:MAG: signal peptide peptidase SppA [Lentisphaerae bacterium]|nr:signal peptide peptidase SppA [Lentisphaerota bacterium]